MDKKYMVIYGMVSVFIVGFIRYFCLDHHEPFLLSVVTMPLIEEFVKSLLPLILVHYRKELLSDNFIYSALGFSLTENVIFGLNYNSILLFNLRCIIVTPMHLLSCYTLWYLHVEKKKNIQLSFFASVLIHSGFNLMLVID